MSKGWDLVNNPADKGGNLLAAWNYVYVVDTPTKTVQVLVSLADGADVTGADLARARPSTQDGQPIVSFEMRAEATARFARLTNPLMLRRHMAIILDGVIQTAPALQATLSSNGIITGYKDPHEVGEIVRVLNSGKLAASLGDPVSERTVGPELGADNIRHGLWASLIGFLIVIVFMGVYYLFAGAVADLALLLNLVLTVCIMFWIRQAWTLPGIAGLILSLAMAVDANVLIYERLREEKGKEGSLGVCPQEGLRPGVHDHLRLQPHDRHPGHRAPDGPGDRGSQGLRPGHGHRPERLDVHGRRRDPHDLRDGHQVGPHQRDEDAPLLREAEPGLDEVRQVRLRHDVCGVGRGHHPVPGPRRREV